MRSEMLSETSCHRQTPTVASGKSTSPKESDTRPLRSHRTGGKPKFFSIFIFFLVFGYFFLPITTHHSPFTNEVYAALSCDSCHKGPPYGPNYTSVPADKKYNSHIKHTTAPFNYGCEICHIEVTTGAPTASGYTIIFATNHANGVYNVKPKSSDYNFTYSTNYAVGQSTCATIECHGGNTAFWGGSVSCYDCHASTTDVDDYGFKNNITASISTHSLVGFFGTGHGLGTGSRYYYGNSGAGFTTKDDCKYCHNGDAYAHDYSTGTNFFRLAVTTAGVWSGWTNDYGYNGNCMVCHDGNTTPPGYLGKAAATNRVKNPHYGEKHGQEGTNTTDGGKFCWDCHDPHGDYNVAYSTALAYMFQINVVELTFGTTQAVTAYGVPSTTWLVSRFDFSTGTTSTDKDYNDYASSHTFRFICQSCHSGTGSGAADAGGETAKYFTRSSYTAEDKHNQGACTTCHQHDSNFAGAGNCYGCHLVDTADVDSYVNNDGKKAFINNTQWLVTGHGRSSATYYDSGNRGAGIGPDRVTGTGDYCRYCHKDPAGAHNPNPADNFFVLRYSTNATCLVCHGIAADGWSGYFDPDGSDADLTYARVTVSTKVAGPHWGATHGQEDSLWDGGRFCWDCHDPHGDFDLYKSTLGYMIQQFPVELSSNTVPGVPAVVASTGVVFWSRGTPGGGSVYSNYTYTDYVSTNPVLGKYRGVCNVCHDATVDCYSEFASTPTHASENNPRCTYCHSHSYNFKPVSPSSPTAPVERCIDCHGSGTDKDNYVWNDGITAKISTTTEWPVTGHGRPSGNYESGRPAANFAAYCEYCHSTDTAHGITTNPFRLANTGTTLYNAFGDPKNGNCLVCHSTVTAGGYDPPGPAPAENATQTKSTFTFHVGAGDNQGVEGTNTDGGRYCWDCHDPHGDWSLVYPSTLAYMIQARPVELTAGTTQAGNTYGVPFSLVTVSSFTIKMGTSAVVFDYHDYVVSSSSGICQTCHEGPMGDVFDKGSYDTGHNPGQRCTNCHPHEDGFKGKGECKDCHKNAVTGTVSRRAIVPEFAKTWSHGRSSTQTDRVTNRDCAVCHREASSIGNPTTDSTLHKNTVIDLRNPDTGYGIGPASWSATPNDYITLPGTFTFVNFPTVYNSTGMRTGYGTKDSTFTAVQINFCLKCHDVTGSSSSYVRSAYQPFDSTGTLAKNSSGTASALGNIYLQFGATVTYHPIRRRQNNSYCDIDSMVPPWNQITKTAGTTTFWGDLISCWDCHIQTGTAHGGAETLRAAYDWVAAAGTKLCLLCHRGGVYWNTVAISIIGKTAFDGSFTADETHPNQGATSHQPGDGNFYGCRACHSGMHTVSATDPADRRVRAEDSHGFTHLLSGSNFGAIGGATKGSPPFAFFRQTSQVINWRPKSWPGGDAGLTDGWCDNSGNHCGRGGYGSTYLPGGVY